MGQRHPGALWPLDLVRTSVALDVSTGKLQYRTQNARGDVFDLQPKFSILGLYKGRHRRHTAEEDTVDELDSQNAIKSFISDFYRNGTLSSGVLKERQS